MSAVPSQRQGMGTILFPGGAAFRVWAPFADSVSVAGDFNNHSDTADPLARESNGYWSADIIGPAVGHQYLFIIQNGNQTLRRRNPYASEVVHSAHKGVIHDPNFDWTGERFTMPPWNELVIYEMHVGTFNDSSDPGPSTFEQIIPKLPYLRDLGINAIEILPVAEFPTDVSWGYNPSQPFSVERALGGPQ